MDKSHEKTDFLSLFNPKNFSTIAAKIMGFLSPIKDTSTSGEKIYNFNPFGPKNKKYYSTKAETNDMKGSTGFS
jgi:hypothetical protein